jgi:ADP-ribose pyrophosphatase
MGPGDGMSGAGFERRARRVAYENPWLRFDVHEIVHPNGLRGEHGVVVTAGASGVVAVDGDAVLLVRQARFAAGAPVVEIVKGGRHAGESALDCAKRELREETGFRAERWDELGRGFEIPSIVEPPVMLFLARDLVRDPTPPEDIESIEVVRMPLEDMLDACAGGEIDDALTALALLRARRHLVDEEPVPGP